MIVLAQATTIAVVALVIGVPLGVLVGNFVWSALAGSIGVAPDSLIPSGAVLFGAAVVVGGLNVIALWPAARARRLRVAEALRTE
jgi:ABC-type antimicrobial peptide transport system permease subunit